MSDVDKLNQRLTQAGLNRIRPAEAAPVQRLPLKAPLKVGLVQVNNSFSGQNYLPYSVACLRSYVEAHAPDPGRYQFLPFIYKRIPIRDIVAHLKGADVVGFSAYVWNANISLEAARRLKKECPDTLIVFGGPQVPDKPEAFLRQHPFIDIVVHNEGERTLLALLERLPQRNWEGLAGVSFLRPDGGYFKAPTAERMRDLAELPSPFFNGMFDQLVAANPQEKWIGLWETNRGCPFQCTFCDWGSATAAKVNKFEMERLNQELDWFASKKIEYIFVCDANFGIQKRDVEIAQRVAEIRTRSGFPQGFSVQNTKNATERAYLTQKILSDAGLNKGVALSMQSLDETTLKNIKRDNISLETYLELSRRFTKDKVETYSDLILALPGETYDSYVEGIDTLIRAGQHNRIQFNNLSILPNAEMGDPDYLRKFEMVTVKSEIINIHGSKEDLDDDVAEIQDLVISTYSLSEADWRRVRAISWMAAFLHFDKIAQIPIILIHELTGIAYREIFERFMEVDRANYPVIGEIRDFFIDEARSIQQGGPEYVYSDKWLQIYWPADEYTFIKLTAEGRFDAFYKEVSTLLTSLVAASGRIVPMQAVVDAIRLNHALVSQPFVPDDTSVALRYNILEFWRGIREGEPVPLEEGAYTIQVERSRSQYADFDRWCREVVWWGNKKGAYLYPNRGSGSRASDRQLAGHF
jgi:radical SAM superfamily enzyme YgiQ (UPF0313 family)